MRKIWIIIVSLALWLPLSATTPEREAQFTYYYYAALRSLQAGDYDCAMMRLLFADELHPNDGQVNEYLGILYDALGEQDKAMAYLRKAYQLAPADLWQRYVTQIKKSKDTDRAEQIVDILENVVHIAPKQSEAWEELYHAYIYTNRYKKALKAQDRLDDLQGYNAYSAINRYQVYVLQEKNKKALQEVEHYLAEEPTNLQFLLLRIEVLEHTNAKWSKLSSAYEDALKVDPQNPTLLNNYAYGLAIHGGDLNQAERMSQMALKQAPDNATFLDTYAWILHLKGQDTLAVFYIRKALDNAEEADKYIIEKHYEKMVK